MKQLYIFSRREGLYLFYRASYDGKDFNFKPGFCSSIEELHSFDMIETYRFDDEREGMTSNMPKRFRETVEKTVESIQKEYERQFGLKEENAEGQTTIFDYL